MAFLDFEPLLGYVVCQNIVCMSWVDGQEFPGLSFPTNVHLLEPQLGVALKQVNLDTRYYASTNRIAYHVCSSSTPSDWHQVCQSPLRWYSIVRDSREAHLVTVRVGYLHRRTKNLKAVGLTCCTVQKKPRPWIWSLTSNTSYKLIRPTSGSTRDDSSVGFNWGRGVERLREKDRILTWSP